MAQYKVPQDVEADDKLLGPFTFRQFVYLMIMAGCIALAFALFNIFPFLALIPVPFAIFFAVLALPLKKDQPMEIYLAAIITYHLKPKNRIWTPGQRESTILITAPKIVEQPRARNISEDEASDRLSFLANVIDTEGYSIRGDLSNSPMRADFREEANNVTDVMDVSSSYNINQMLAAQQTMSHEALVAQMRQAINNAEGTEGNAQSNINNHNLEPNNFGQLNAMTNNIYQGPAQQQAYSQSMQNLANNTAYSIQTISQEAARIQQQQQQQFNR